MNSKTSEKVTRTEKEFYSNTNRSSVSLSSHKSVHSTNSTTSASLLLLSPNLLLLSLLLLNL
ncbi:MAG: hypothetical protein O9346_11565 [Leptospiraceae bacterium]|nr:hypothetical protein [Leptospiraceae bacterium]MCZ8347047.1 hypothetical protein [Leptospiraceae bacterium]PJE01348.1 MAG: hypothetical protein CK427_11075 [Leptospira sp.]